MRRRAFVSYSFADGEYLGQLRVVSENFSLVIFPGVSVRSGDFVSNYLIETLLDCDDLIYVKTDLSDLSAWVAFEIDLALRHGKGIYRFTPGEVELVKEDGTPRHSQVAFHWSSSDQIAAIKLLESIPQERQFDIVNYSNILAAVGRIGFPGMTIASGGCAVFVKTDTSFGFNEWSDVSEVARGMSNIRIMRYHAHMPPLIVHVAEKEHFDQIRVAYETVVPGLTNFDICFIAMETNNGQSGLSTLDIDFFSAHVCFRNFRENIPEKFNSYRNATWKITGGPVETFSGKRIKRNEPSAEESAIREAKHAFMMAQTLDESEAQLELTQLSFDLIELYWQAIKRWPKHRLSEAQNLRLNIEAELARCYLTRSKGYHACNLLIVQYHATNVSALFGGARYKDLRTLVYSRAALACHKLATIDGANAGAWFSKALDFYEVCVVGPTKYVATRDIAVLTLNALSILRSAVGPEKKLRSWLKRASAADKIFRSSRLHDEAARVVGYAKELAELNKL